jgi:hypothetical protein
VRILKWLFTITLAFAILLVGSAVVFLSSSRGSALRDAMVNVVASDELNGQSLESIEDLVRYLEAHPERYALAAWDVGREDAGVFHDADTRWPLASTVKIIPLALASEELAAGTWDAATPTPEVEAFYLPGTDGGAHLRAGADGGTSTLGGALHGMIRFSDNAATDAILFRLGRARVQSDGGGLPSPHPLSGTMLVAAGPPPEALDDAAWAAAATLLDGGSTGARLTIAQQEEMTRRFDNRGTARAFAALMERLFTDPSHATALARTELSWPMEFAPNQRDFVVLATKGGSLAGTLTSASYGETKTGQRRVVALFLHDLPFATWIELSRNYTQQKLERELLLAPDALVRLGPRLSPTSAAP